METSWRLRLSLVRHIASSTAWWVCFPCPLAMRPEAHVTPRCDWRTAHAVYSHARPPRRRRFLLCRHAFPDAGPRLWAGIAASLARCNGWRVHL